MAPKHLGRWLLAVTITVAVAVAGIAVYRLKPAIQRVLTPPGCSAGDSHGLVALDPGQAAIAATIAGVAHRRAMPPRAVTIAYATAWQESKLQDLDYGDRDSVGVFQQRPSEGWGPAAKLMDPAYAATKFFEALARIPGYRQMPVYQAAQDVQRSADGSAYAQYEQPAAQMAAAFTGGLPHAVWCWSPTASTAHPGLKAASAGLAAAFGRLGIRTDPSAVGKPGLTVSTRRPALSWAVAAWLVTHAPQYHLGEVIYDKLKWQMSDSSAGWTPDTKPAVAAEILAS